ncbi:MAG: hypothetical protein JO223_04830 [Hyphomicrobiales bacterium]|nr:hypothetical protein [Hyphomicrobiales bacterium]MBV8439528.1 hypothetical protein [Hyphomicrobiales bacterium]
MEKSNAVKTALIIGGSVTVWPWRGFGQRLGPTIDAVEDGRASISGAPDPEHANPEEQPPP